MGKSVAGEKGASWIIMTGEMHRYYHLVLGSSSHVHCYPEKSFSFIKETSKINKNLLYTPQCFMGKSDLDKGCTALTSLLPTRVTVRSTHGYCADLILVGEMNKLD